jgi:hypothetical protein
MRSAKSVGRIVGLLLLTHLAAGLTVPFILLERVRGSAGLVAGAAASPGQVRAAVLLLFVGSAVAIGITIAALPTFRRYSSAMALWLLALAVAAFSLQAVDNGALLSMLSLSQEYAEADAAKAELFQALAMVVTSARRWTHFTSLLVAVSWIFLFYSLLYRFRLVPRALGAFGLIGSLLQITGVTLRALLGYSPVTVLAMPLAPAYVALAVWLMAKGFDERPPAEAQGPELAAP